MNNIKQEMEKIEIPKELNNRVALGVQQAKEEKKREKRYPRWMLASIASVMILIGTGYALGGSNIVDATQSFISQLLGSKENFMQAFPNESKEEISYFERHLKIAKENLTEEEFNNYSQLIKEQTAIWSKIRQENREPDSKESRRLHQIKELQRSYTDKFKLIEVQQYASYPITKPTYIPEGYKKVGENFSIYHKGEEPVTSFDYSDGENVFWTEQLKINQTTDLESSFHFEKKDSYSLRGLKFEYGTSEELNKTGMKVIVPEKGYKIIMAADILSKEEMEKVLQSMIER
ncbi:DUF4367 domain-containing protein [Rummeliibacillus suwonensis]|uniref:DUF4367 domain-containing protein n=1 Tax=Rummeliibacillus suwonensis TaxID=1306154 RepID=UPI0011B7A3E5|nr:DUF4367 domain-containing protein [Rummeliibacillus suwonensis]